MRFVIYEENPHNYYPLVNLYPVFNLRIGMKTIAENTRAYFPKARIDYMGREIFEFKKILLNETTIYLSSQFVMTDKITITPDEVKLLNNKTVVGFIKHNPVFPKDIVQINKTLKTIKKSENASGFVIKNLWDLIKYNEALISHQFQSKKDDKKLIKGIKLIGDKKNLSIAKNALIHTPVVIDTSNGPVYIDQGAVIKPFSTIVGPSYIGVATIIDGAKVIKSSIGPHCRIGGEVESCIFQGYANKHHEGFLGHSFIGEWVNLGALTTNSDLKNNYAPVRIKIGRKEFDTGMIKLGCFVGDHTKTGIGTLIPTGAVIGSFVNFFNGGMMPGYVSNFEWLTKEKTEAYKLEPAIKTARIVMKRRNIKMSRQYENLIRTYYKNNR